MTVTASSTGAVLTISSVVLGGIMVQAARVWLDRRGTRAQARADTHRLRRALLRRYPDGPPPLAATSGDNDDPERNEAFLSDLSQLTRSVAGGWPTDSLTYTLERLMDALTALPTQSFALPQVQQLYDVCSDNLVALDLGVAGARHVGPAALPIVGTVLRTARELRARADLAKVMPPRPHGLPRPPSQATQAI